MRDRLIELLKGAENKVAEMLTRPLELEEWLGIYADYLLANGVIVPPCKVGDTVYYPAFEINSVLSYKVISIKLNSKSLYVVCENCLSKSQMTHRATQIGKTVFLTREEAEAKLKGE